MHIAYVVLNTGGVRIPVDEKVCTCRIQRDHDRVNGRNVAPVSSKSCERGMGPHDTH